MRSYSAMTAWLFSLVLIASVGCGRDAVEDICSETDPCAGEQICVEGACYEPDDLPDGGGEDGLGDGAADIEEQDGGHANPDIVSDPDVDDPDREDIVEVACEDDRGCPAAQSCVGEVCVDRAECLVDRDCTDDEICLGGSCTYSPECDGSEACSDGYECVGGQCFEEICRGADDCEDGELCDGGECIAPPAVDSCFVADQSRSVSNNQRIPLQAFALDADGEGLAATFVWTSSDPSVATIAADNQSALGAGGTGSTTLSAATAGGVACAGEIVLTGESEVAVGDLRVRVFDEESGAPVVGAEVVITGQAGVSTDASGVAALDAPQGAYSLSVFADDYNYITINGLDADDVRIPLAKRAGSGPVAGFTGQFDLSAIHSSGDVTLGLAGASIAGGLLNLNLQSLLGESFMSEVSIPGVGGSDLPLPGGLVVYGSLFGLSLDIKADYYATSPGGASLGWGLAGNVPGMELFTLLQSGGDTTDMLTTLLPLFSRFDHANRPLNLVAAPRVADVDDINGNGSTTDLIPDYDAFPSISLKPGVKQVLASEINVSNFPQMSNGPATAAVLVGGTLLEGPGFVPLGISATADEDGDGRPDNRRLTMAPPYGSLSGGRQAIVAIAFEPGDVAFEEGVELPDEFSVALWNGQSLPGTIGLGAFPDASIATLDASARTLSVQADAGPLFRVRIVGEERSWDVWSVGPAGSQGQFVHDISIPAPTGGNDDLLQSGEVFIDAISAEITMNELVSATGIGLTRAGLVSTRFNRTKLN